MQMQKHNAGQTSPEKHRCGSQDALKLDILKLRTTSTYCKKISCKGYRTIQPSVLHKQKTETYQLILSL